MDHSVLLTQTPGPGEKILAFRGDTQSFTLSFSHPCKGSAWIRTNMGHVQTGREEIIRNIDKNESFLGRDWYDIPMCCVDDGKFLINLPLCDVGHFEAKCFFLSDGETRPIWPEGPNTLINVHPADTCCANIIYNAFVRQFGPNISGNFFNSELNHHVEFLDKNNYTVIPPSGTFRDLIQYLDFIINDLGCRIIQLLPIHPAPATYARMGRFGSPYAALSFTAIDPALAGFDPRATPLEQFMELVDAIHERQAKIIIDIAINHTGWAAGLHETHPDWLVRDKDGRIEVPGAWGTKWADLTRLDYTDKKLWKYMADVFLTWCRRQVDGFRCDAGYMLPVSAWRYIVATVRLQYPDTVFFLEGLGGNISVTQDILNTANFNWAYSELFQNYDRNQIESYLPLANEISTGNGIMVHFAETHDNNRLASRSRIFAKMRTALCALFSHQGCFGFANGVEWYATQKIDVHGSPSLNWGAESNQIKHIQRLNIILKKHPAFHDRAELNLVQQDNGNSLALLRHHLPSGKKVIVAVNLNDDQKNPVSWDSDRTGIKKTDYVDLIAGNTVTVSEVNGIQTCFLKPGNVLCLTADDNDLDLFQQRNNKDLIYPYRIKLQQLRAKGLDVYRFYHGTSDLKDFEPDSAAKSLEEDPVEYCRKMNPFGRESRVIIWNWPGDLKREVMVPPDHFLIIIAPVLFRASIEHNNRCLAHENSLECKNGTFFALFAPLTVPRVHYSCTIKLSVYNPDNISHDCGVLLYLSRAEDAKVKLIFNRRDLKDKNLLFLDTNNSGAMLRVSLNWEKLKRRYDALLAGNLNPDIPEDRWVMFTRCRAWLVYQDYSQKICNDCFYSFSFDYSGAGCWKYKVPTGKGKYVLLTICAKIVKKKNLINIVFSRKAGKNNDKILDDNEPVRLILRPDIENRNFHEATKAYTGLEDRWPEAVKYDKNGFVFQPDEGHRLNIRVFHGDFIREPEWLYMVHRDLETDRGFDPDSDLFSPGYFSSYLQGGRAVKLTAGISSSGDNNVSAIKSNHKTEQWPALNIKRFLEPDKALDLALDHYVVKREDLYTVIAGYPWFLDWGRDSLIFTRGLIAAGKTDTAIAIIKQFGRFEKDGTIPNMIHGHNAKNRDTSDAPLWFFAACGDILNKEKSKKFLDEKCGNRSVRRILYSIANAYMNGTGNGIRMDPESALIFSPAHFTWMDTNHPAGTPRKGYPIEIQALWYCALSLLAQIDPSKESEKWSDMAARVKKSVTGLFFLKNKGYLSDCLHAGVHEPAKQAEPDDGLRPNQLLAITMDALTDVPIIESVVSACQELLIPGGIRSLADRPVDRPLVIEHNGKIINDPRHPYWGKYEGDEDSRRKPAYHNGTAWTWLFPSFCEAWVKVYGKSGKQAAMSWLAGSTRILNKGCVGHVPEISDGDFPHTQRGCDAQAWGASEILRVWKLLEALD